MFGTPHHTRTEQHFSKNWYLTILQLNRNNSNIHQHWGGVDPRGGGMPNQYNPETLMSSWLLASHRRPARMHLSSPWIQEWTWETFFAQEPKMDLGTLNPRMDLRNLLHPESKNGPGNLVNPESKKDLGTLLHPESKYGPGHHNHNPKTDNCFLSPESKNGPGQSSCVFLYSWALV